MPLGGLSWSGEGGIRNRIRIGPSSRSGYTGVVPRWAEITHPKTTCGPWVMGGGDRSGCRASSTNISSCKALGQTYAQYSAVPGQRGKSTQWGCWQNGQWWFTAQRVDVQAVLPGSAAVGTVW